MIQRILEEADAIVAIVLLAGALARWLQWRLDRQRSEWEALMQQQRETFQTEIESARNENLQQRAIADSIYSNVSIMSQAMLIITKLADSRTDFAEHGDNLQRILNVCEKSEKRQRELLRIAKGLPETDETDKSAANRSSDRAEVGRVTRPKRPE